MRDGSERVIYEGFSDNTLMEVVDHGSTRSLYFSKTVLQSRILLSAPHELILFYTRYMVSALLAKPEPKNILIIGVGAGSLIQFLNHHFPDCIIDGVDFSSKIIDIAQAFFSLQNKETINLHCQDGFDFLADSHYSHKYDIIFLDAFDATGMAKRIYSREFFSLCLESLSNNGVLSLNLWSADTKALKKIKKSLHQEAQGFLFVPVKGRENIVALAFDSQIPWDKIDLSDQALLDLSKRYSIDFMEIVTAIRKKNMKLGQKLASWFT